MEVSQKVEPQATLGICRDCEGIVGITLEDSIGYF